VRTILNALDAAGVDDVPALSDEAIQRLHGELNLTSFASWSFILRNFKTKKADK
jgi:hypothetical protein